MMRRHISRKSHPLGISTLDPIYGPASAHPNMVSTRTRVSLEGRPNTRPRVHHPGMEVAEKLIAVNGITSSHTNSSFSIFDVFVCSFVLSLEAYIWVRT